MKKDKLQEKWFEFTRIYCKEGFIDMVNCDAGHDPNDDIKPSYNLNYSVTYSRLNGKGEWIYKDDLKGLFEDINTYHEVFTANELWDMAQVNAVRRATGKDKLFCEELYKTHGDFRLAIKFYSSNPSWIF